MSIAARFLTAEEHLFPVVAAVQAAVDTALAVRAVGVTEGGDVDDIWVERMHDYFADEARIAQAHMLPGIARHPPER